MIPHLDESSGCVPQTLRRKYSIEIAIHGRGGQGAKTAGDLLTYALYQEGLKPHGQPRYSADRMGAPVSYWIRFNTDRSVVHDRSWTREPQIVVLFDMSLLEQLDIVSKWRQGIVLIVNSQKDISQLKRLGDFRLAILDGNRIAKECGLMKGNVPILSSAMSGAFAMASEMVSLDVLLKSIMDMSGGAVGRYLDANLSAAKRGYTEVQLA